MYLQILFQRNPHCITFSNINGHTLSNSYKYDYGNNETFLPSSDENNNNIDYPYDDYDYGGDALNSLHINYPT